MKIITFASKDFQWLAVPFYLLLEKYLPGQHVVCFGDENNGLPEGIEFLPLSHNFVEEFGEFVKSALSKVNDEIILVTLIDMWLRAPADLVEIEKYVKFIREHSNQVARIGIGTSPRDAVKSEVVDESLRLYTVNVLDKNIGLRSGLLLWPSLWNKKLVTPLLENKTLWDFEVHHSQKLANSPIKAFWTDARIYCYAHVLSRYSQDKVNIKYFSEEDKELILANLPPQIGVFEV